MGWERFDKDNWCILKTTNHEKDNLLLLVDQ